MKDELRGATKKESKAPKVLVHDDHQNAQGQEEEENSFESAVEVGSAQLLEQIEHPNQKQVEPLGGSKKDDQNVENGHGEEPTTASDAQAAT